MTCVNSLYKLNTLLKNVFTFYEIYTIQCFLRKHVVIGPITLHSKLNSYGFPIEKNSDRFQILNNAIATIQYQDQQETNLYL